MQYFWNWHENAFELHLKLEIGKVFFYVQLLIRDEEREKLSGKSIFWLNLS